MLCLTRSFNGSTELPSSDLEFSGRVALEAAKKVRRPPFSQNFFILFLVLEGAEQQGNAS